MFSDFLINNVIVHLQISDNLSRDMELTQDIKLLYTNKSQCFPESSESEEFAETENELLNEEAIEYERLKRETLKKMKSAPLILQPITHKEHISLLTLISQELPSFIPPVNFDEPKDQIPISEEKETTRQQIIKKILKMTKISEEKYQHEIEESKLEQRKKECCEGVFDMRKWRTYKQLCKKLAIQKIIQEYSEKKEMAKIEINLKKKELKQLNEDKIKIQNKYNEWKDIKMNKEMMANSLIHFHSKKRVEEDSEVYPQQQQSKTQKQHIQEEQPDQQVKDNTNNKGDKKNEIQKQYQDKIKKLSQKIAIQEEQVSRCLYAISESFPKKQIQKKLLQTERQLQKQALQISFQSVDTDKDGKISLKETLNLLKILNQFKPKEKKVKNMIKEIDGEIMKPYLIQIQQFAQINQQIAQLNPFGFLAQDIRSFLQNKLQGYIYETQNQKDIFSNNRRIQRKLTIQVGQSQQQYDNQIVFKVQSNKKSHGSRELLLHFKILDEHQINEELKSKAFEDLKPLAHKLSSFVLKGQDTMLSKIVKTKIKIKEKENIITFKFQVRSSELSQIEHIVESIYEELYGDKQFKLFCKLSFMKNVYNMIKDQIRQQNQTPKSPFLLAKDSLIELQLKTGVLPSFMRDYIKDNSLTPDLVRQALIRNLFFINFLLSIEQQCIFMHFDNTQASETGPFSYKNSRQMPEEELHNYLLSLQNQLKFNLCKLYEKKEDWKIPQFLSKMQAVSIQLITSCFDISVDAKIKDLHKILSKGLQ